MQFVPQVLDAICFLQAVEGEAPFQGIGEDGIRALAVALAAYQSSATGEVIALGHKPSFDLRFTK